MTSYLPCLWICLFRVLRTSGITQHGVFGDWRLSLSATFCGSSMLYQDFVPVCGGIIFGCAERPHFIYPRPSWWPIGSFPLFRCCGRCCREHGAISLPRVDPGLGLPPLPRLTRSPLLGQGTCDPCLDALLALLSPGGLRTKPLACLRAGTMYQS